MAVALLIFWASTVLLAWVYVAYPLLARAVGALRPVGATGADRNDRPTLVSVGLAVHNGAAQVGPRIANILGQQVPFDIELIVASDGSTDDTTAVVRRLAAADRRIRLLELARGGQAAAQTAVFAAALGDVVVLTDVETRFSPGCLAALVGPLADRRVGCVTGVLRWQYDEQTETASHESLYWRYEQTVRNWESRAGWLAAATGAVLAVRRSLFQPVPAHASLDQMLPLIARAVDQLVVVEPAAIASDRGTSARDEQFRARVRIATQGIEANLRMARHILPWRQPGSWLAIWSHKLLRWASPYLGLVALVGAVSLAAGGETPYALPVVLTGLVLLGGVAGYVAQSRGRPLPLIGLALTVITVNVAFALAWLNVIASRRVRAWESQGIT